MVPEFPGLQEPMKVADNSKASNSSIWQEDLASCKGFCTSVNSGTVLQDAAGKRTPSILTCTTLRGKRKN